MTMEQLEEILLSKRDLRDDPIGSSWINEFFYNIIEDLKIANAEIIFCNSLQKRCSCATMLNRKIIIIDNYLSEIFIIFNQILNNEKDSRYLGCLFYKLMFESFLLNENIRLAAIYNTLAINSFRRIGKIQIKQVTRESKPQYLYAQQAFLVMHEIMHSLFKDYADAYKSEKTTVTSILERVFYKSKLKRIPIVSNEYIEELCCDHLAAICAISISIDHGHCSEIDAACAIIMALHYQYLLLCIDKIVEHNYLANETSEFAVRMTVIRLFVINYFKVERPELVDSVNAQISNVIETWKKRYLEPFTTFLSVQKLSRSKYEKMDFSEKEIEQLRENLTKNTL